MKKIFIASKNKGKIYEIKSLLNDSGIEVYSVLDNIDIPDVKETGNTFKENALIKAKGIFEIVKMPVLADDSGLETDALNGAPGVYSARYSGTSSTDTDNYMKLLGEMEGIEDSARTARFKCVIVLYDGKKEVYFEGTCNGKIALKPSGENGFGYDPVFIPDGYNQTFGELGSVIKNKISHRGKAMNMLQDYLLNQKNK